MALPSAKVSKLARQLDWRETSLLDQVRDALERSENQHTVVTQTRGTRLGKRVVRGRDAECAAVYRDGQPVSAT
jgi:DNA polymerase (family 10)